MADVSKMAEEWLSEHPDATKKEIWMAGYWQSTDKRIENATTKQAVVFIGVYSLVILRNIGRAINKAVHKLPWLFIVVTVVISFIVSFVFISKARAERDSYNQKLVHATQQLDSFYAAYGNLKSK
jgi:uncharacterized membrane protein (DUF485 family)